MDVKELFDFKVVAKFKDIYFKDLLQKQHLHEKELFIQSVKTPEDPEGFEEAQINSFFYELKKEGKSYLLPSELIKELPLQVTESQRIGYKGNGYNLIKNYKPARFKPEKHHSFKEIVDGIAPFEHTDFLDFTLYKIGVMASLFDRLNFRCSSEPAFGKDSFMALLDDFTNNIGIIQNPTIAKLEFMSMNKILMCNEVVNLEKKEIRDIEQYLLSTGDFSNKYTKRSRGSSKHGSKEEYDISQLSLVVCYNNKDCYRKGTKYFDNMFQRAVLDRFPAFKFKGKLCEDFKEVNNATELAEKNIDFFVKLIRSINWWSFNWEKEQPSFELRSFKDYPTRMKRILEIFSKFIARYAQTEEEYNILLDLLLERNKEYKEMLAVTSDQDYVAPKIYDNPFGDYENA